MITLSVLYFLCPFAINAQNNQILRGLYLEEIEKYNAGFDFIDLFLV
jgi:hypothetical protein